MGYAYGHKWTPEDDARLTQFWTIEGLTAEEISSRMGLGSRACVLGRLKRIKAKRPERRRGLGEKCRTLWAEGLSQNTIAGRLGIGQATVHRWLNAKRAPVFHQVRNGACDREIERMATELAKQIPPDTRDITARVCGDPIPGRRAIDRTEMRKVKGEVPFSG